MKSIFQKAAVILCALTVLVSACAAAAAELCADAAGKGEIYDRILRYFDENFIYDFVKSVMNDDPAAGEDGNGGTVLSGT